MAQSNKDTELEGKLVSIREINIDFDYEGNARMIYTNLRIETEERLENVTFNGFVLSDSIGHKVKYKFYFEEPCNRTQILEDLEIKNRTYKSTF